MDGGLTKVNEEFVVQAARDAGVSDAELQAAFAVAQMVKDTPARLITARAKRLLASGDDRPAAARTACCG